LKILQNSQQYDAPALLEHLRLYSSGNPLARAKLQGKGHPAPWLLAARVLHGGELLKWPEFWDVLRWYAHNRGYDDQVPWVRTNESSLSDKAQHEKEQEGKRRALARALMNKYGTRTMAETVFSYLFDEGDLGRCDLDPRKVDRLPFFQRYFKQEKCIFPREIVKDEVRRILQAHRAILESTSLGADIFMRALLEDWTVLPEDLRGCPKDKETLWLPKRYGLLKRRKTPDGRVVEERTYGGLLFGQLIPRFENRLVSICPFTFARRYEQLLTKGLSSDEWKHLPAPLKARLQPASPLPEEDARHLARVAAKVPSKASPEFLNFRWAMLLADMTVCPKGGGKPRPLSAYERKYLNDAMQSRGTLSLEDLRDLINRSPSSVQPGNLDDLFTETPERAKELYVDPARHFAASNDLAKHLFPLLPESVRRRVLNELRHGHALTPSGILQLVKKFGCDPEAAAIEKKVQWLQDAENLKSGKRRRHKANSPPVNSLILHHIFKLPIIQGRAPYHRHLLTQVVNEILAGFDPRKTALDPQNPYEKAEIKAKDGCLVKTPVMWSLALGHGLPGTDAEPSFRDWLERWRKKTRKGMLANEALYQKHGEDFARAVYEGRASDQWLAQQTNNHLVRQRLLLMQRLTQALIDEFSPGKPENVTGVTIEVARDLLAFSGMKKTDIGSDTKGALNSIKAQHFRVQRKLEKALAPEGKDYLIGGKLLWKAKIADDLNWKCPYTQEPICPLALAEGRMDVDHIIPRSQRLTNAMEACVITFKEINQKKKNLTSYEFVRRFAGTTVGGLGFTIKPLPAYIQFVDNLKTCRASKGARAININATAGPAKENEDTGAADLNPMYLPGSDRLHPDFLRRRKRKLLLKIKHVEDQDLGFAKRDLTITSHLNRLAQSALMCVLPHLRPEHFTALPGVVTGSVRDMGGWQLLGVLGKPDVCGDKVMRTVKQIDYDTKLVVCDSHTGLEQTKKIPLPKSKIRELTHLHHAVDACTLGLLAQLLPKDGKLWEYLAVGELTEAQAEDFRKRAERLAWNGHPFTRFFNLNPIPEDERGITGEKPRTQRVVAVWSKSNKAAIDAFKQSLATALAAKRVRLHIPAERGGMPANRTVYRVLTALDGNGYVPQLAREVVSAKERRLKATESALEKESDKARRKGLAAERDALAKLVNKLRNFEKNVWLINRVRADSVDGKRVLKRLKEYEDWIRRHRGDTAHVPDDASQKETADDEESEETEGKKSNRKKLEPNLLRPYNPKKHRLLYRFDVVSKKKVIGLPPDEKKTAARLLPLKASKAIEPNFAAAILPAAEVEGKKVWRDGEEIEVIPFFQVNKALCRIRRKSRSHQIRLLRNGSLIYVPRGERQGWWRVTSVKETEAYDIALDLALPDGVKIEKGNATVATLLTDGMEIVESRLTGHDIRRLPEPFSEPPYSPCPSTSSA
jgi:CRISPR-associated endonuclease Csn1